MINLYCLISHIQTLLFKNLFQLATSVFASALTTKLFLKLLYKEDFSNVLRKTSEKGYVSN